MKDIQKIIITKEATIKEALKIINQGSMRIVLVVDDKKLIGVISDPDIRRSMLDGYNLEDKITDIINTNPIVCNISDTKEQILEVAISKKIYEIPIVDDNGNLIGIEEIDELLKPSIKTNKVVLMVGGLGTRLRPLTEHTPKPMLKVGNKPILETIILNFKKYGFTNIILSVSYKSEVIEEYFQDGKKFGVNIEYIHEDKRMGTAGALSLMRDKLDNDFFVMNGDLLTNINFEHMMQYHILHRSIATMGVREYDFQVPYGVVNINGENIVSIVEKPLHKFFVSAGVYVLDNKVLDYIPNDEFYDMPTLFENIIKNKLKSISFPIHEYWLDIGRIDEYEKANNEYCEVF